MSTARNIARLVPNASGVLPTGNLPVAAYATPKAYHATTAAGGITTSQTRASLTVPITNSTNKLLITGSDLLRASSGVVRGVLKIDGINVENEFMYVQGNANTWVTQTGIYTAVNLSVGSHTIEVYADFTSSAGSFDGPFYLQVIVWDGPSA